MHILNASGFGTKTIVNNRTERSRQSHDPAEQMLRDMEGGEGEGGLEGSVIVNADSSMVVAEDRRDAANFLNRYISDLRQTDTEADQQKQLLRQKIAALDEKCLAELEEVYSRYKATIGDIFSKGNEEQFYGMDTAAIRQEFNSKLHSSESIKDFLIAFPKYVEREREASKEF